MQDFDTKHDFNNRNSNTTSPSTRTKNTNLRSERKRFSGLTKINGIQRYLPLSLLVIALILRATIPSVANFSYVLLIIYALLGRANMLHAVAAIWFFTMSNAEITGMASSAVIWRFVIVQLAAVFVFIYYIASTKKFKVTLCLAMVMIFGLYACLTSIIVSNYPLVSILKCVNWVIMCVSLMAIWQSLSDDEFNRTGNEIFCGLCALGVISLLFLKSSSGYSVNGTGFNGVMNHPQSFGVTLAVTSAWIVARVLTHKNFLWLGLIIASICLFLTLKTECRTAGLALAIATAFSALVKLVIPNIHAKTDGNNIIKHRIVILSVLCAILFSAVITLHPRSVNDYLIKRRSNLSVNIVDIYLDSRGILIDTMISNVKQHPFTGVGFGVSSDQSAMNIYYDPYFNLPISAVIEKGVLPVAVLEETGMIGFIIFSILILSFIVAAIKNGFPQLLVLTTVLLTNLGEYTFFSLGGNGMLLILIIAWCVTKPSGPSYQFRRHRA